MTGSDSTFTREEFEPVIISWSGLKRWEMCRQLHLRYITKQVADRGLGRTFLPGTITDRAMRRWLESDDPQRGQMEQWVDEIFAEHTGDGAEYKIKWKGNPKEDQKAVKETCREAVTELEPILERLVLPYDYFPELKFKAHFMAPYIRDGVKAPITMRGGIDVIVRHPNGDIYIYDLKTTRDASYLKATLAQLTFYGLAWSIIEEDFSQPVGGGFIAPLIEEKVVPVTITADDTRHMMSRIVQYAQGVWTDDWAPNAHDDDCTWCEAKGICPKFKTIAFRDEHGKQRVSFAQAAAQRKKFRSA